ncbi:hypothetical protein C2L89_06415 [Coxiella burnetii]|nr:hypothetical protein C2L89_06415 [Coxiella burnetii]
MINYVARMTRTEGRGQRAEDRGQKAEDRRQKTEDRRQWLCRYATTKFYKLIVAKPHEHCPLSSA